MKTKLKTIREYLIVSKLITGLFGVAILYGCSTAKKAELSTTNPQQAIQEVQALEHNLVLSNGDVLATEEYSNGVEDLEDATKNLNDNKSRKEVMNQLAQAKAHFLDAQKVSQTRKNIPAEVFTARQNAIGVGSHRTLKSQLKEIDESLRDESDVFTKDLSATELSRYQNKYLGLEVEAVQKNRVGAFRMILNSAEENDATDLAPKTFKTAKSDLKIAENLIRQSPRDPSQYSKSVEKANKSAKLLSDVMGKLQGEAQGSSENVALKLVYQERKLGKLSNMVENLQGSLGASQYALGSASKQIAKQDAQILSAKNKVKFQKAMNQVRKSFSDDEASVYQQGESLIIRLKKINFKSGKATIPTTAMPLLSKVSTIVNEVDPKEVVIEGHTDSLGEQGYNMLLSNKRAKSVKTYFSSLNVRYAVAARGFGESKPIANNETRDGRYLNRRVDIVVKANN